ncbi:MAG: DNA polymerase I [Bacteroidetes bacterium]|nr:DNA polymerase I [Bacteroidota bacterium]
MNPKKQFLVVDGYALIYRSYFAFINRPIRDSSGRNVSVVFGFFRTLFALLKEYKPEYIAVAMDSKTPTFRHKMYPEYKATRDKTPDDLRSQIPLVEKALNGAGVSCLRQNGLEADDLIATLAHNCRMDGMECLILTGDKDLMQLIGDSVFMLRPVKGEYIRFDAQTVYDHLGVRPDQVVDYLSLIGDASDNIPGVKGIGPKGAVKLLAEYGDLDTIYDHLNDIPAGASKKLSENRDNAYLSRELIVLQKDADCETISIKDLAVSDVDWTGAVPVFQEIQSSSLVAAAGGGVEAIRSARKGNLAEKSSVDAEEEKFLGKLSGKGSYKTVKSITQLQKIIEQALEKGEAAFDIETDSINDMQATPVGFSISWELCKGFYIPLRAGGTEELPETEVRTELKQLLENPDMKIIGQNYKYDYKVLKRWGINQSAIYFDTMIAAWLLNSTAAAFNMDRLAETYLNYTTIKYSDVVPKGFLFPDIELAKASEYAAEDADVTYRLYLMLSSLIKKRGMENVMYHVEMPILKILADMELRGMRILPEQLKTYEIELKERLEVIKEEIFTECGHEFNLNSTKQLQEVLFTERGLRTIKKTKTGFSTNVAVLEELARVDIIPGLILQHRSLEKLRNTYVEALPVLINPDTGRLHTTLLQTGTATGRLSSKNPNLQNIPIRSEDGRRIRSAFVPTEGFTFLSADYSQIELVVLAHFADDPGLKEAFVTGSDVHKYTGALIFGVDTESVTAEQRRIAKTINFGVMYGMSAFRLSQELGIPRSDAAVFIEAYFQRYSGVRKFIDTTVENAEKTGKVMTLLGHERVIPGIASRNRNERSGAERIAVNTPIQGTAADILKLAMISIQEQMDRRNLVSRMVLQVHDELIFEVPEYEIDEMRELVRTEMEGAVSLNVPLSVSLETGDSWGDLH